MPSWSIHNAHVERLLTDFRTCDIGIADENAFLFGNYVPDVYLGYMVPDTTYRLDYCLTHLAARSVIPVPDADGFWDRWIYRCRPESPGGVSLVVGAWAHLVADHVYNKRFRLFCQMHETPRGDELRIRKQADFALFGNSLAISRCVDLDDGLLEAARGFAPYTILPEDAQRAVEVANGIAHREAVMPDPDSYQLLGADWMHETFESCNERLATWLQAWVSLEADGQPRSAAAVRARAGLPPAEPIADF